MDMDAFHFTGTLKVKSNADGVCETKENKIKRFFT